MPASVNEGYCLWLDGSLFNGLLGRQAHIAATFLNAGTTAQVTGGVLPSGGGLAVTAGSGMSVNIASGYAVIPSSSGSIYGGYLCAAMSAAAGVTVATSDPTNPRIDLVAATVTDNGNATSFWSLQVITGTPAGSPAVPALPASSIALAEVLVPALSSSVTGGNVTDERTFTTAQGGITPVGNLTTEMDLGGYEGSYIHDRSTHRLAHLNAAAAVQQPVLLPFAPQSAAKTTSVSSVSAPITVCSVAVTTDGSTDIEIHVKWPGLYIAAGSAFGFYGATLAIQIDGTTVAYANVPSAALVNTAFGSFGGLGGGGFTHVTASGTDRPSAATHTVALVMTPAGDGTHQVQLLCTATGPGTLYVRPAPL